MNDIEQGALGDCYFLSALSAIGEWPSRLNKLFLTNTTNSAGVFATQIYIRGIPNTVVIDDYLPFSSKGKLVFDNIADDGSLFAPLMEKAWAKVNGNYENIIAGTSMESLGALLGVPATQFLMASDPINYDPKNPNSILLAAANAYTLIQPADRENYIMTATTGASNSYSLITGHVFSLIGVFPIMSNNIITNRLFLMRNPWGVTYFSGKWNSTDYASWTPANKRQVDFENNTIDGLFFIEDKDFV